MVISATVAVRRIDVRKTPVLFRGLPKILGINIHKISHSPQSTTRYKQTRNCSKIENPLV